MKTENKFCQLKSKKPKEFCVCKRAVVILKTKKYIYVVRTEDTDTITVKIHKTVCKMNKNKDQLKYTRGLYSLITKQSPYSFVFHR